MTEKIVRRGIRVPSGYATDPLESLRVVDAASKQVVTLRAEDRLEAVRAWMESDTVVARHQGFPVLDHNKVLVGVLTRRDLLDRRHPPGEEIRELIRRSPCLVYDDCTLREALDHMLSHDVGRLRGVARDDPRRLVGILTRSDILSAYRHRLDEGKREEPNIALPSLRSRKSP